jgi:hypothetical protein
MDSLDVYRQIIETVLNEYASVPYAYGDIQAEVVIDRVNDRYLIMTVGWDDKRRVHGCIVHIDIIGEKLWIQRDGTEHGIALDLVESGVPKESIVLAFRPLELRQYTEYAVT